MHADIYTEQVALYTTWITQVKAPAPFRITVITTTTLHAQNVPPDTYAKMESEKQVVLTVINAAKTAIINWSAQNVALYKYV